MSNYVRIDGNINIIDSFEKAEDFLLNKKSLLDLKWFVFSFHHAIQSLMLYALVDSAEGSIWKENKKGTLPIRRDDGLIDIFHKDNRLLGFMESFTCIQDKSKMNRYINSKFFIAERRHIDSMKNLNKNLRNKFVHYVPISWSIEEQYIYEICKPALEVASFLVLESGQCGFKEDEKNKLKNIFYKINLALVNSDKKCQSGKLIFEKIK